MGSRFQGFLCLPPGVDKNNLRKKLPLIVNEHGGPLMGYGHRFSMESRYYASQGYAVLLPNPRGSAGRGVKFLELNRGNIDGDDFKDIMSGVDYCESRGWIRFRKRVCVWRKLWRIPRGVERDPHESLQCGSDGFRHS